MWDTPLKGQFTTKTSKELPVPSMKLSLISAERSSIFWSDVQLAFY